MRNDSIQLAEFYANSAWCCGINNDFMDLIYQGGGLLALIVMYNRRSGNSQVLEAIISGVLALLSSLQQFTQITVFALLFPR